MNIKRLFGVNLRYYRRKRGLSQEQLAEKVSISVKHIGAIETGASFISAELLESFSETLHVSTASFFYTPEQTESGDSCFEKVDDIIEKHLSQALLSIKQELRDIM